MLISPDGMKKIAEHMQKLHSLVALQMNRGLSRLDEGQGIAATLTQHNARWQKYTTRGLAKTKLYVRERR